MLAFTNPSFEPQSNLSSSIDIAYFNPFKLCRALVKSGVCNISISLKMEESRTYLPIIAKLEFVSLSEGFSINFSTNIKLSLNGLPSTIP